MKISVLGPTAFGLFVLALIFLLATMVVSCDESFQKERVRKQKRLDDQRCYISGYYGRSGEYKIYNCMGWIVKEHDL